MAGGYTEANPNFSLELGDFVGNTGENSQTYGALTPSSTPSSTPGPYSGGYDSGTSADTVYAGGNNTFDESAGSVSFNSGVANNNAGSSNMSEQYNLEGDLTPAQRAAAAAAAAAEAAKKHQNKSLQERLMRLLRQRVIK
jgi:hypothetical protein